MIERYLAPKWRRTFGLKKINTVLGLRWKSWRMKPGLNWEKFPKEDVAWFAKADFDIDRILKSSSKTRHDVVASHTCGFWNAAEERLSLCLTSTDMVDNGSMVTYTNKPTTSSASDLNNDHQSWQSEKEHKFTIMMGQKFHGVHAEPYNFWSEIKHLVQRNESAISSVSSMRLAEAGKIFWRLQPRQHPTKLKNTSAINCTLGQPYIATFRDLHAAVLAVFLVSIAPHLSDKNQSPWFKTDNEVEEFLPKVKRSSAMLLTNGILVGSESAMVALVRVIRGHMVTAYEDVASPAERDILTHVPSCIIAPDYFQILSLIDHAQPFRNIPAKKLTVFPENMILYNMESPATHLFGSSRNAICWSWLKGMTREQAWPCSNRRLLNMGITSSRFPNHFEADPGSDSRLTLAAGALWMKFFQLQATTPNRWMKFWTHGSWHCNEKGIWK